MSQSAPADEAIFQPEVLKGVDLWTQILIVSFSMEIVALIGRTELSGFFSTLNVYLLLSLFHKINRLSISIAFSKEKVSSADFTDRYGTDALEAE